MHTDPATMTNAQIVKHYTRCQERDVAIARQMIADGFGNLRPSDMRTNPDVHPLARESLSLMARCAELSHEANQRYGPGLIVIEHLLSQGKTYRRVSS